jgi:hypothetical protein
VVKVRLQGDTFASDVLVTILRDHPAVEILTGPDKYDGDRRYLLVRVAMPAEMLAQLETTEFADRRGSEIAGPPAGWQGGRS